LVVEIEKTAGKVFLLRQANSLLRISQGIVAIASIVQHQLHVSFNLLSVVRSALGNLQEAIGEGNRLCAHRTCPAEQKEYKAFHKYFQKQVTHFDKTHLWHVIKADKLISTQFGVHQSCAGWVIVWEHWLHCNNCKAAAIRIAISK
jgi:hypothetical protein